MLTLDHWSWNDLELVIFTNWDAIKPRNHIKLGVAPDMQSSSALRSFPPETCKATLAISAPKPIDRSFSRLLESAPDSGKTPKVAR